MWENYVPLNQLALFSGFLVSLMILISLLLSILLYMWESEWHFTVTFLAVISLTMCYVMRRALAFQVGSWGWVGMVIYRLCVGKCVDSLLKTDLVVLILEIENGIIDPISSFIVWYHLCMTFCPQFLHISLNLVGISWLSV